MFGVCLFLLSLGSCDSRQNKKKRKKGRAKKKKNGGNEWTGPPIHVVFDEHFTTGPIMEKNEVPPHWAHLIEKSHEKDTEAHYGLAKTWLFPDPKPGDISLLEWNQNVSNC